MHGRTLVTAVSRGGEAPQRSERRVWDRHELAVEIWERQQLGKEQNRFAYQGMVRKRVDCRPGWRLDRRAGGIRDRLDPDEPIVQNSRHVRGDRVGASAT